MTLQQTFRFGYASRLNTKAILMTTHIKTLYTITEIHSPGEPGGDEWFVMTAPIEVISHYFMMHPEAGQRIIRECAANDGKGVCQLYISRGPSMIDKGGIFRARLHSTNPE